MGRKRDDEGEKERRRRRREGKKLDFWALFVREVFAFPPAGDDDGQCVHLLKIGILFFFLFYFLSGGCCASVASVSLSHSFSLWKQQWRTLRPNGLAPGYALLISIIIPVLFMASSLWAS